MKIGFLPMSGVRVYNKELLELGLTLPGFVERSKVIASLPSLGLLTLAGMMPKDFDIEYVEVPEFYRESVLPGEFDIVAISSFTAQIHEAYRLADCYRANGTKVILGGLHVTALPEEALQHADAVLLGEGEITWPSVLNDLKNGSLKKIYDARNQSFDLKDAPLPRFDLLNPEKYNRITIQTQRGCPYNCEFCGASIRLDPRYKLKPVHKVVEELSLIKKIWEHPFIEFADDNAFANKQHGKDLAKALIGQGVRWFTETDISVADDDDLLELLKESGCAQLLVGLESPSAEGLSGLETKINWKQKRLDHYMQSIEKIQNKGITVNGCFILGLDRTDVHSFDDIWDFVKKSGLYEVQITVMTAFPGTPLYGRLEKENRIIQKSAWEKCTLFDVNFMPEKMSVVDLEKGLRELGKKIYNDEFTEYRKRNFLERLRRQSTKRSLN